ncbi:hypothetical protein DL95DRAFT_511229 [Leptodontidium sp. 2 PMI_412]|nr:hypothetical protein DL95DRAFT_511229 [Leptodontidium sp. 2 PMI_412]
MSTAGVYFFPLVNLWGKTKVRKLDKGRISRLEKNVAWLDVLMRRDELVHQFYKKVRLSQVTNDEQIPLIELEQDQAKVADNNSLDKANDRSCDRAVELIEEQNSGKYERNIRGRKLANKEPGLTISKSGVKNNRSTVNSLQLRKNNSLGVFNRYSARIAEREERLRAAVVVPLYSIRTSRKRTVKLTQAPTPPSTQSQEREPRSRAIKTSKRGCSRRGDRRNTAKPQGILKKQGRPRP